MEAGRRNKGFGLYCQHAEAVGRLLETALEKPDAARGLVKCALHQDERGYALLCEILAAPQLASRARPHALPRAGATRDRQA